jgi:hypothetical protein
MQIAEVIDWGDEADVYVLFSPHRFDFGVKTADVGEPLNPVSIPVKLEL